MSPFSENRENYKVISPIFYFFKVLYSDNAMKKKLMPYAIVAATLLFVLLATSDKMMPIPEYVIEKNIFNIPLISWSISISVFFVSMVIMF